MTIPHALQNLAVNPFSVPHFKHFTLLVFSGTSALTAFFRSKPQLLQNFAFSELAA